MIDVLANDPSLLMAAVAAIGLGVLLRRLRYPRPENRAEHIREQARHEFGLEVMDQLRSVETDTIDLESRRPIDLRESLDLTEDATATPSQPPADEPLATDGSAAPEAGDKPDRGDGERPTPEN
ncbi:MAG: hypothetical protein P8N02_06995 [Actinomycetota bacterium]|nr:hypothetical protein [Actinomycetota bacterium]